MGLFLCLAWRCCQRLNLVLPHGAASPVYKWAWTLPAFCFAPLLLTPQYQVRTKVHKKKKLQSSHRFSFLPLRGAMKHYFAFLKVYNSTDHCAVQCWTAGYNTASFEALSPSSGQFISLLNHFLRIWRQKSGHRTNSHNTPFPWHSYLESCKNKNSTREQRRTRSSSPRYAPIPAAQDPFVTVNWC